MSFVIGPNLYRMNLFFFSFSACERPTTSTIIVLYILVYLRWMLISIPQFHVLWISSWKKPRVRVCVHPFTNIYILFVSLVVYTEYILSKFIWNNWIYFTDVNQVLVKMGRYSFFGFRDEIQTDGQDHHRTKAHWAMNDKFRSFVLFHQNRVLITKCNH